MTLDEFITRWRDRPGGRERAEFPQFITEFCAALDLPVPSPGNLDYAFEAPVTPDAAYSDKSHGRIDLYKRGHFVLEAKQSRLGEGEKAPPEPAAPAPPPEPIYDLLGEVIGHAPAAKPVRVKRAYDRLMEGALAQAKGYALALPAAHGWPPFLIVCDVGKSFELYFDWTGNGKGYGFFPDQKSYRVELDDLRDDAVRDRLRGIWTAPEAIDPRKTAVRVTREIASRLARVAAQLEKEEGGRLVAKADWEQARGIEETALFLMRTLFCMFAEDVELLPKDSFKAFLAEAVDKSEHFWKRGLADLWGRMDSPEQANRYWSFGDAFVRYFNGNLFSEAKVFDLPKEHKGELLAAANCDWKAVEPAIFGTLLEQVLTGAERAKLGAHYTPRPYVERLVDATVMEVLRSEWEAVRVSAPSTGFAGPPPPSSTGEDLESPSENPPLRSGGGGPAPAEAMVEGAASVASAPTLQSVTAFHARLLAIRILDPACGTGNFLYVAMENLLRLESDVIELERQLGGTGIPGISPNQFLGIEKNPRAAVIAELVLWIGWLRFRLANTPDAIRDPVLPPLTAINGGRHGGVDALLAQDAATGEVDLANPVAAAWPEADFIVGNPPFIGGQDLRDKLGGDYAEALWHAVPAVPKSADLVMQWWHRAAALLTADGTRLRRFGFVTTNSITQSFSRRVIAGFLAEGAPSTIASAGDGPPPPSSTGEDLETSSSLSNPPLRSGGGEPRSGAGGSEAQQSGNSGKLSLTLAIPDHPWTRATRDAAAVRIAMTVAEAGARDGTLIEIVGEAGLDTDTPALTERPSPGRINADLTVGTDVTSAVRLAANRGICHDGVKLHGKGFSVTAASATALGLGSRSGLEGYLRPYRNGKDLSSRTPDQVRDKFVIDLFGLEEKHVREHFPEVYQHLLRTVKPERDSNRRETYKRLWWIFGEPRRELRPALAGLTRYIATVDTAKHRIFQFVPSNILCDDGVVIVGSDDGFCLGVLSSELHSVWVLAAGGWLGVGNDSRYFKSLCFDPFPFPDATPAQRKLIGDLAEELDLTRRVALDENPGLTMTGLYNMVAALRSCEALTPAAEAAAVKARARIVQKLHADLDSAVAAAYGWPADLTPTQIVANLAALNAERAAEEKAGTVRWLRPDYQAKG